MNKTVATIACAVLVLVQGLAAEERTFPVQPGEKLEVDMRSGGRIAVLGSERNEVKLEWQTLGGAKQGVRIDAAKSESGVRIDSRGRAVDLLIEVPRRFDLDLTTRGGNISVRSVEGTISGETMGGNLVLKDIQGDLTLSTKGGNISIADSDADGKISTMGGNITITNVAGNARVSTMGGNIVLENVAQRGEYSIDRIIQVSTMGGNITVAHAPQGAKAETKGGDITVKKSAKFVEAKTMGGSITIGEHDGRVNASTMGGNVSVSIVPGSGDQGIDISSMGGRIRLELPAEFSGDFDLEIAYTRQSTRKYEIKSDFPIHVEESPEWSQGQGNARRFIRGTGVVGGGANKVRIRTVNGDILLLKK